MFLSIKTILIFDVRNRGFTAYDNDKIISDAKKSDQTTSVLIITL